MKGIVCMDIEVKAIGTMAVDLTALLYEGKVGQVFVRSEGSL